MNPGLRLGIRWVRFASVAPAVPVGRPARRPAGERRAAERSERGVPSLLPVRKPDRAHRRRWHREDVRGVPVVTSSARIADADVPSRASPGSGSTGYASVERT